MLTIAFHLFRPSQNCQRLRLRFRILLIRQAHHLICSGDEPRAPDEDGREQERNGAGRAAFQSVAAARQPRRAEVCRVQQWSGR